MAADGPVLGASSPTLNHDDFSLYGYMSDDELMQLAIERSLTETHNNSTTSSAETTKSSTPQRRTEIPRPGQRPTLRPDPTPCPANPPRYRVEETTSPHTQAQINADSRLQTRDCFYNLNKL